MNLSYWDGSSSIRAMNGVILTKEDILRKWPFAADAKAVMQTTASGDVMSFDSLDVLAEIYQIDGMLPDDEKLEEIKRAMINAQNPDHGDADELMDIIEGRA